jgi:CHAD domain-containing protein
VFLIQLENHQPDFETSDWQQLQPLRDYLLLSRAEAQNKLIEELKSSRYRQTIKQWREHLKHFATENDAADDPGKPVFKLADELLREVNQQTLEQGKTITRNSDAETLHSLRKSFKQLRYLMEFFSSLYPAVELRALTQSLTDIQDDLGLFNDRHFQVAMVQAFIQQSKNDEAIKASVQLIQILLQQQDEAGKNFKDSYKKYASSASQKKFNALFVDYHQGKMKL